MHIIMWILQEIALMIVQKVLSLSDLNTFVELTVS